MAYGISPPSYPDNVRVGRHTYGLTDQSFFGATPDTPITVGNFCSFAAETVIFATSEHRQGVSTYQFSSYGFGDASRQSLDGHAKGAAVVGNDVWVGRRALILSGVEVGNGAIIGAGAVVARSVPPYAIVVGNPAKVVRYRFDVNTIEDLQSIAWWEWPDDKLLGCQEAFYGPVSDFINKFKITDPLADIGRNIKQNTVVKRIKSLFGS